MDSDYINGFLERRQDGRYEGRLTIDGIDLSPIQGAYFDREGEKYLWIQRKRILEYDDETQSYMKRPARPQLESYLKKQVRDNGVAYMGELMFLKFRYRIFGIWDRILGMDKHHRLNLFVERLPNTEQTIINGINEYKKNSRQTPAGKRGL